MAIILCDDVNYTDAANFYVKKLNIPEDTVIGIKLYNESMDDITGYCDCYGTSDTNELYFIIGLDISDREKDIHPMSVLAHELVHVKQYVTKELVEYDSYCTWHGATFTNTEDEETYFFNPWEIEAYGRQIGLYHLYLKEFGQ